jgi:hypothetical protein
MPYWGNKSADCDYAFDAIGSYIFLIKERMFKGIATVSGKSYPEQGIIASLQCIRLIAEDFPKCVLPHFSKNEFENSKTAFFKWYELVQGKLPQKYRESIRLMAEEEFTLFEERVLTRTKT